MRRALLSLSRVQHVNQLATRSRWASTKSNRPKIPPLPKQGPIPRASKAAPRESQTPITTPRSLPEAPSAPLIKPVSQEKARKYQAPALVGALLIAGAISFYSVILLKIALEPCHNPDICQLQNQKDVASVYDSTADGFDSEVAFTEWVSGVEKVRKELSRRCKGDVLEVSCGTGRNLGYYSLSPGKDAVSSLTFVDLSPQMIDVCKRKWDILFNAKERAKRTDLTVRFFTASALDPMPLAPVTSADGKLVAQKKYTTIFQTMGLCSISSPVELIQNMANHLDYADPEARIYLLEHGRSYAQWLNRILDNSAVEHADIHGCWYNREIGALVEEAAAKCGLDVVWERRRALGTVWAYELKPASTKIITSEEGKENDTKKDHPQHQSGWWNFIRVK